MSPSRRSKIVVALALMMAVSAPAAAHAQTTEDTVTVGASRTIDVAPDLVRVYFGVRAKSRTAEVALEELAGKSNGVLDSLRAVGLGNDELSTGSVRLRRACIKRCEDPNPRDKELPDFVMGYKASASIVVETDRIDDVGEIMSAGVAGGADTIRSVAFDVEDKRAAVIEALRQAMEFAGDKAQVIAETGGRTLGSALVITEGNTQAPRPQSEPLGYVVGGSGGAQIPSGPLLEIEPPTLHASARVTVTYELL